MVMSFPPSHKEEEGRAHVEPIPFGGVGIRDSKTIRFQTALKEMTQPFKYTKTLFRYWSTWKLNVFFMRTGKCELKSNGNPPANLPQGHLLRRFTLVCSENFLKMGDCWTSPSWYLLLVAMFKTMWQEVCTKGWEGLLVQMHLLC